MNSNTLFTLDAYAAISCPVKTQNSFMPGQPLASLGDGEELAESFAGGHDFRTQMLSRLLSAVGHKAVDLRCDGAVLDSKTRIEATLEAMDSGVRLIVGPQLPPDLAHHRAGSPDALLLGEDSKSGGYGYYPLGIKFHLLTERRMSGRSGHTLTVSKLNKPFLHDALSLPDLGFRVASRAQDLLQMAHYARLLDTCGHLSGDGFYAALLGTDEIAGIGPGILWMDLYERQIRTFSRTAHDGQRRHSALERYDHEHLFRVRVAQRAMQQNSAQPAKLMVRPIVIKECDSCRWWDICLPQLDAQDLSLRIDKAPLDVREISALRALGVETIEDLAEVKLEQLLPNYLPLVAHRASAKQRILTAHHRASMLARGVELERISQHPIEIASSCLEIDFDVETSASDYVYLWGFLVTETASGKQYYRAFHRFEDLDDNAEFLLAQEALTWLAELLELHPDAKVYHYSEYERVRIRRLLRIWKDPVFRRIADCIDHNFVDLFQVVREHFFGIHGLGLKAVAQAGPGFAWRDDNPGGLNSQSWFDEAIHATDADTAQAARTRVLEYNEDDVRATCALRLWLREQN